MQRIVMLVVCCALASLAQAEVFKWIDADGKVQYGDRPPAGAKTKKVSGGVTVVPSILSSAPVSAEPRKEASAPPDKEKGGRSIGIGRKAEPEAPAPAPVSAPVDPDAAARAEARLRAIELCRQNRGGNCENEVDAQLYGQPGYPLPGWSQPPIRPRPIAEPARPKPAAQDEKPEQRSMRWSKEEPGAKASAPARDKGKGKD